MLTGHYATALIPYELTRKTQKVSFWVFLLAAQFLDVLMLLFVSTNIESFSPSNFLEASFTSMRTDMFLSHDIVPVIGWSLLFGAIVWAVTRKYVAALWCIGLVLFHEVCDLVVGFEHFILGVDTTPVGLALYTNAPAAGMLLEAAMCFAIVFWFARKRTQGGDPLSKSGTIGLYLILVGGALSTLPLATQSINSWLGL